MISIRDENAIVAGLWLHCVSLGNQNNARLRITLPASISGVPELRKTLLGLAILTGLFTSAAGAATLNFVAEANTNGERGINDNTTLTIGGLAVKFNTDGYHAYFDASSPAEVANGGAGLGVCKVLSGTQCTPSSDDNVTSGEHVTLSFLTSQTISGPLFNQDGHFAFAGAAANQTLQYALNGGSLITSSFASLMTATFLNVSSIKFAYGGANAAQFYLGGMTAVSSVPLPAGAPLLLGALAAFGALRRRKRQA
jgi:hypothetical protein